MLLGGVSGKLVTFTTVRGGRALPWLLASSKDVRRASVSAVKTLSRCLVLRHITTAPTAHSPRTKAAATAATATAPAGIPRSPPPPVDGGGVVTFVTALLSPLPPLLVDGWPPPLLFAGPITGVTLPSLATAWVGVPGAVEAVGRDASPRLVLPPVATGAGGVVARPPGQHACEAPNRSQTVRWQPATSSKHRPVSGLTLQMDSVHIARRQGPPQRLQPLPVLPQTYGHAASVEGATGAVDVR